ncbi:hypothetical protein [Bifidobacterium myosotis]|uniref:Uncharacterized protein n=1 Tax=Bifidobacterium myosotis TaxID=1630166 RepID=A0A5M9ZG37_9BIFI|nr:hypothetical protein [Bifidobacterium myosotis]KAA8825095.1 hypothetical protein EMO91_12770 [Bifidobacterium myosotis]
MQSPSAVPVPKPLPPCLECPSWPVALVPRPYVEPFSVSHVSPCLHCPLVPASHRLAMQRACGAAGASAARRRADPTGPIRDASAPRHTEATP